MNIYKYCRFISASCLVVMIGVSVPSALSEAAGAVEASSPAIQSAPCATPPFLDGILTDACWQSAAVITNFYPFAGGNDPLPLRALLCVDAQWIYLAFDIFHPCPQNIKQTVFQQDGNVHQDDSVEIFIDPSVHGVISLNYRLNAANIKADQVLFRDGRRDPAFWMPWRSATKITENGWQAEVALPLKWVASGCKQLALTDLSAARINLMIRSIIPTFDPYGAVQYETIRIHTWPAVVANAYEPDRYGALQNLPAGTVPPADLPFIPQISRIQIGGYDIHDGKPGYAINIAATNRGNQSGRADVTMLDRPLGGAQLTMSAKLMQSTASVMTATAWMPLQVPGARELLVWLIDAELGGAWDSRLIDEQAMQATVPLTVAPDRNYYTMEQQALVECRLNLPDDVRRTCDLRIRLADGKTVGAASDLKPVTRIAVSLREMADGIIPMIVELWSTDEKLLASQELVLRKYQPNSASEIKTDPINRIVLRDGRPFFPFGLISQGLCSRDDAIFRRIADAGYNTVVWWAWRTTDTSTNELAAYMQTARRHGLMVISMERDMHPGVIKGSKGYNKLLAYAKYEKLLPVTVTLTQELAIARDNFDKITPALEASAKIFQNCPNFLGYWNVDEPNLINYETRLDIAGRFYKNTVSWDPWHPVLLLFSSFVPPGKQWTDYGEILAFDPYIFPGLGKFPSSMNYMTKLTMLLNKRAASVNKPMWIVPLAESVDPGRCPRTLRPAEQRVQTYLAVIHGAKGLLYFINTALYSKDGWEALSGLAREMTELAPAILAPPKPVVVAYDPVALDPDNLRFPDVQAALFCHPDGGYIMLAANSQPYPVTTRFELSGFATNCAVHRLFASPQHKSDATGFDDRLDGYATRAYRINGIGEVANIMQLKVTGHGHPDQYTPEPILNPPDELSARHNVIPNSSIEAMSSPGLPDYIRPHTYLYHVFVGEPGAVWGVETNNPFHGRQCLMMQHPRDIPDNPRAYLREGKTAGVCHIPALPNPTNYVFSAYMRAAHDGDQVAIKVDGMQHGAKTFQLTTDWRRYSLTGVIHHGRRILPFYIAPAKGVTVWVDALQMEAGQNPTSFQEK